jgi:cell wall-associated NlpC family hydrolase
VRRPADLALVAATTLTACGLAACGAAAPHSGASIAARVAKHAGTRIAGDADSEVGQSFALSHRAAGAPEAPSPSRIKGAASATTHISRGAKSDAEVRRELREMDAFNKTADRQLRAEATGASLAADGTAEPPEGTPDAVAHVLAAGNVIARFPYVYGGGHGSFVDSAYDCSGSVSYALAAGGMLGAPETSGELAHWGVPGPGRWITVFANAGHTFMYVAGLRFDTSGRSGAYGSRWQTGPRGLSGFTERHWPGL